MVLYVSSAVRKGAGTVDTFVYQGINKLSHVQAVHIPKHNVNTAMALIRSS